MRAKAEFVDAEVYNTLLPGYPGTHRELVKYGNKLVRVRYRYDAARREHIKTVELICARTRYMKGDPKRGAHDSIPHNKVRNWIVKHPRKGHDAMVRDLGKLCGVATFARLKRFLIRGVA